MTQTRVQKFIALSGLCSRRKAEELIKEGKVTVNDKTISIGDTCIETDKIEVEGVPISFNTQDFVYIIMNKSSGYLTAKTDEFDRKTIYELLAQEDRKDNLFSVGILDKDISGLLILTNDGQFSQSIIHPKKEIEKEYIVQTNKELRRDDEEILEKGIELDGYKLKPLKIRRISANKYSITIFEERKKLIKRMFEQLNYKVINLHRIRIGKLDLKDFNLAFREYEFVTKRLLEEQIFE